MVKKAKAKPAKAKAKPKKVPTGNGRSVSTRHNGPPPMTFGQRRDLAFQHKHQYSHLLARKKEADAVFKNRCKLIRSDLGKDGVDLIKAMILLGTDQGELLMKQGIAVQLEAAQYEGANIGSQLEMFGPSPGEAIEIARGEGRKAGKQGKPAKPPYDPGDQFQAWLQGHGEGNAELAESGIKTKGKKEKEPKGPEFKLDAEGETVERTA